MSPTKERIIDQRKLRKAKSQKYRQQWYKRNREFRCYSSYQ
jgi:flagellum-specific peptidoglycan hydrolase FlgJ